MATWRLANSLIKLRDQLNLSYPTRNKASDGSIGDPAHAARNSDHNPDERGIVCAIDVTNDPTSGPEGRALANRLTSDPRVKYVIFAGKIWKARTGQWETYRGPNPHNHHVHISVKAAVCDDETDWALSGAGKSARSTLRRGDTGTAVQDLQKALGAGVDGAFGQETERAVRAFQSLHGLIVDGVAGPATWAALDSQ